MDEKLDKLLKRTLTLTDEPSSGLNRRILDLADTAVENGLALGQTQLPEKNNSSDNADWH